MARCCCKSSGQRGCSWCCIVGCPLLQHVVCSILLGGAIATFCVFTLMAIESTEETLAALGLDQNSWWFGWWSRSATKATIATTAIVGSFALFFVLLGFSDACVTVSRLWRRGPCPTFCSGKGSTIHGFMAHVLTILLWAAAAWAALMAIVMVTWFFFMLGVDKGGQNLLSSDIASVWQGAQNAFKDARSLVSLYPIYRPSLPGNATTALNPLIASLSAEVTVPQGECPSPCIDMSSTGIAFLPGASCWCNLGRLEAAQEFAHTAWAKELSWALLGVAIWFCAASWGAVVVGAAANSGGHGGAKAAAEVPPLALHPEDSTRSLGGYGGGSGAPGSRAEAYHVNGYAGSSGGGSAHAPPSQQAMHGGDGMVMRSNPLAAGLGQDQGASSPSQGSSAYAVYGKGQAAAPSAGAPPLATSNFAVAAAGKAAPPPQQQSASWYQTWTGPSPTPDTQSSADGTGSYSERASAPTQPAKGQVPAKGQDEEAGVKAWGWSSPAKQASGVGRGRARI